MKIDRLLLVLAVAANGVITGAAFDQTVKQLPARHELGLSAYSAYAQAADLAKGVAWYGGLGVTTALLTLVAVVTGLRTRPGGTIRAALWTAAAGTLGHTAVTSFAAPTYHSQRDAVDAAELAGIFDTFVALNGIRAGLILVTFGAVLVALLVSLRAAPASHPAGRSGGAV